MCYSLRDVEVYNVLKRIQTPMTACTIRYGSIPVIRLLSLNTLTREMLFCRGF